MKTTILHLLSLVAILSFSSSCGKKDESKSNPIQNANQPLTGIFGSADLTTWYNTVTDSGLYPYPFYSTRYPGLMKYKVVRKTRTYSSGCNASSVKVLGLDLGQFQYCNQPTPTAVELSTTELTVTANFPKSSVAKLAALMNGSLGVISKVDRIAGYKGASIFFVDVTKSNGALVKLVIDTSVNPEFNPISTFDSETKVEEFVSSIKPPFEI